MLQIGANSHSEDFAFAHDPVPRLIAKGWSAILIDTAHCGIAMKNMHQASRWRMSRQFCPDVTARLVPLLFINGTKSLGANE